MAENKLQDTLGRTFELEMPFASNLTEYLDELIPTVKAWSEDLRETHFYENKPWLEVSDQDDFHDTILHFFNSGGEYLRSIEGNVIAGSWRYMEGANKLLVEHTGRTELFDLAFMNDTFFILRKHGNPQRLGEEKYFMMIHERKGRNLEWRDAMELLFNRYRSGNVWFIYLTVIVVLVIIIFTLLSIF